MAGEGGVRSKAVNGTMSFPLLQNTLRKATYLRDAGVCDFQGAKRKLRRRGDGDGKEAGGRSVRGGASRTPRRCREPRSLSFGPRCRVSRRQAPGHGDALSAGLAFRTRCGQTVARETNPAQQPLFVNEVYLAHDHTQSLTEWRRRWTSRRFCARCSPLSGSSFLRAGTVSSLLLVLTRHSPMHRVISPHLLGACLCPGPAVSLRDAKINDATAVLGGPQSSDR